MSFLVNGSIHRAGDQLSPLVVQIARPFPGQATQSLSEAAPVRRGRGSGLGLAIPGPWRVRAAGQSEKV
ncbi:MAG: hypothetical protein LBR11_08935 [Deltaproteobacteria bacterium]|nr:hypothetical protein [Deltaproteobacteria bacterium]